MGIYIINMNDEELLKYVNVNNDVIELDIDRLEEYLNCELFYRNSKRERLKVYKKASLLIERLKGLSE